MNVAVQDFDAAITWTQDWSTHLTRNGGLTITGATATCADDRVAVDGCTVNDGATVTFHVTQTAMTAATIVNVTVQVNLSNGDIDERDFRILFTNT